MVTADSVTECSDYTFKVDALLKHARDFTLRDFLDLAFAALDQYGLSAEDQRFISAYIVGLGVDGSDGYRAHCAEVVRATCASVINARAAKAGGK